MGLREMFAVRETTAPDHAAHGTQPGEKVLTSSTAHVLSMQQAERSTDVPAQPVAVPAPPRVLVEPIENDTVQVRTYVVQPGKVEQVLHRDPFRALSEINNQSQVAVALCATAPDANGGVDTFPPTRSIALPKGGTVPRKQTHGAPMWIVIDPAAGGPATVDVYIERRTTPRP